MYLTYDARKRHFGMASRVRNAEAWKRLGSGLETPMKRFRVTKKRFTWEGNCIDTGRSNFGSVSCIIGNGPDKKRHFLIKKTPFLFFLSNPFVSRPDFCSSFSLAALVLLTSLLSISLHSPVRLRPDATRSSQATS